MTTTAASLSSLSRFTLKDEHLLSDALIKAEIARAFDENRCFEFYPDADLVSRLGFGEDIEAHRDRISAIRAAIFDNASKGDSTVRDRLASDTQLSSRLTAAIVSIHRAMAESDFTAPIGRRFVLIKERSDSPTIYHVSPETTVISHVGQGPQWEEIPTIYLGLNIFDVLMKEAEKGGSAFHAAFKHILMVEERAIQTGYSHTEIFSPEVSQSLNLLVDEVIAISLVRELEAAKAPPSGKIKRFTDVQRETFLRLLDARVKHEPLNYDYNRCMKAVNAIERLARRYKKSGDRESLREVVRLLVAASGHDIHEVRNSANIILERVFAPKEFDAPLATRFLNLKTGDEAELSFDLPDPAAHYFVRVYRNTLSPGLIAAVEEDIDFFDVPLSYDEAAKHFIFSYVFTEYGHYDFLVYEKGKKRDRWLNAQGTSGRINVIPDVRGEIILEIFPDIHGHTGVYWADYSDHPGLVYNENGQVIRLGRFSDITAHLEDLKERYFITALYLLGVQKRGSNREDWAPEASSPSPFSPMSLVEIEPALGGEDEFRDLVAKAHSMGIKIIVDIVPHVNRRSNEVPDSLSVRCYDGDGNLTVRASTDGRFGSWNDGKLLNYRCFEVWEWLAGSILKLIDRFDVDGIRFDSAHAVPIMMKKNNYQFTHGRHRSHEEMVTGDIIVNEREDGHFMTTGYFDCACRDLIAIPIHQYIMLHVEAKLRERKKEFFVNIAECYWGHERYLTRSGIIPYNSALFKICENIIHGKTDVREIYHVYDNYLPQAMPEGTELLGILGNHDERRALNTFGQRGLRASVAITIFMSDIIMDYEGSAEGEGWKVFLDNIYVNWNSFEYASHRSVERFYRNWYSFQRRVRGRGYLVWANNTMAAAALKFSDTGIWLAAFNFADSNQSVSIQFDNPTLPLRDDMWIKVVDLLYSPITGHYSYFTGRELKVSRINTVISYTERVKLMKLEEVSDPASHYDEFLRDSFFRLCTISNPDHFGSNFAFQEISSRAGDFDGFADFISSTLVPLLNREHRYFLEIGLKRALFHISRRGLLPPETALAFIDRLAEHSDGVLRSLGESLRWHNQRGSLVFMSAEAEPFSKSGGLANVVYELPRELARLGEEVYVITGMYRHGDDKSTQKMREAIGKYGARYTGKNVKFKILNQEYEVGVHSCLVDGVTYFLLDHYEFFDGLYWGFTAEEKLRRRVAFARACAEVICTFGLRPHFTFTNDAYAGLFNGIVRSDHVYASNPNFQRTTFLHIIHNGGWQYFDAYNRYERGFDLFNLFNLPHWKSWDFTDPHHGDSLNCMAAGIRAADRTITVSPSYAKQIEYACDGLERILSNVIGISNAIGRDFRQRIDASFKASRFQEDNFPGLIDEIARNGRLREKIASRYPEILEGLSAVGEIADELRRYAVTRTLNKLLVQRQRGFEVDPDIPLFTMIHRITEQKGFQLVLESSQGLFRHLGYQAIIGGAVASGDQRGEELARGLYNLATYYQNQVSVSFGYQEISIPLFASDIFCMPSMNEPGGISQLEGLACGCLIVARATGGLRDTVFPMRVSGDRVDGNGFLFSDYTPWAFYDAMERAAIFLRTNDDNTVARARLNAERSIYYWDRPARQYIQEIYGIKEIIRVI